MNDKLSNIKVVKFGGSSLADANQFKKVASIILSDPSRVFVVASAPGKRDDTDEKVTDMLLDCYAKAASGNDFDAQLAKIKARFDSISAALELPITLDGEFETIRENLTRGCTRDYVASRGEYLNSKLLASFLGFDFIDPAGFIFFDADGNFDANKTNMALSDELRLHKNAVVPGFYGSMPSGEIKTFSRGGSDVTGSIVARAVNADLYENWTDVSGFMMADPRIVPDPLTIKTITYRELRELSYMGATVLHEEAIFPVRYAGIPINIRNTLRPEDPGTMIVSAAQDYDSEHVITGVAGKRGFTVITLEQDMMNSEPSFGRRVLEIFEEYGITFEHLPSGIDTMSVVLESATLEGRRDRILNALRRALRPDSITVEDGVALIAVVGRGMVKARGTAARVFSAISSAGINIRMIDQGSSELNIIIGVEEHDFDNALRAIYSEFVKS